MSTAQASSVHASLVACARSSISPCVAEGRSKLLGIIEPLDGKPSVESRDHDVYGGVGGVFERLSVLAVYGNINTGVAANPNPSCSITYAEEINDAFITTSESVGGRCGSAGAVVVEVEVELGRVGWESEKLGVYGGVAKQLGACGVEEVLPGKSEGVGGEVELVEAVGEGGDGEGWSIGVADDLEALSPAVLCARAAPEGVADVGDAAAVEFVVAAA